MISWVDYSEFHYKKRAATVRAKRELPTLTALLHTDVKDGSSFICSASYVECSTQTFGTV
jgi:hypothetical protein